MEAILQAEPRSETGKGPAHRLRASGRVPAVLYGAGVEPPIPVQLKIALGEQPFSMKVNGHVASLETRISALDEIRRVVEVPVSLESPEVGLISATTLPPTRTRTSSARSIRKPLRTKTSVC